MRFFLQSVMATCKHRFLMGFVNSNMEYKIRIMFLSPKNPINLWWEPFLIINTIFLNICLKQNENLKRSACWNEVSLSLCFRPVKFDNFKFEKMPGYKTVSVAQTKNLLDLPNQFWCAYEGRFFMFFGAKEIIWFS